MHNSVRIRPLIAFVNSFIKYKSPFISVFLSCTILAFSARLCFFGSERVNLQKRLDFPFHAHILKLITPCDAFAFVMTVVLWPWIWGRARAWCRKSKHTAIFLYIPSVMVHFHIFYPPPAFIRDHRRLQQTSTETCISDFYCQMYGNEISDEELEIIEQVAKEVGVIDEAD